jgi:hypothetical protein
LIGKPERVYKLFKIIGLRLKHGGWSGHFDKPGPIGGPKNSTDDPIWFFGPWWRLEVDQNHGYTVNGRSLQGFGQGV